MVELKIPRAHSNDWYDNLAKSQAGYFYPWQSTIGEHNGEESFLALIRQHLTAKTHILEVGCGHGELALSLVNECESIIAYDRVPQYIELAQNNAKQNAANTSSLTYLCHEALESDSVTLPAKDNSIDMIIGRRAPLHWIADAKRVCKPGAVLIALCPMEEPIPAWSSKLPSRLHYENSGRHTGSGSIHQSVDNRLHQAGLMLDSGWGFDVPEVFASREALYNMITWGLPAQQVPPIEDIATKLDDIFDRYATSAGIELRHCRYLWRAFIH
ncbi:MAG: class I SAM-dependent methyltransferase [Pseudomonadales bacterium]|nr:class I SAM-dependent methyltransferase [Pseudomonadales bacterium]